MEFLGILILLMGLSFASGYAFRGLIGREVKKLGAEFIAAIAKMESSVKAEFAKAVSKAI